MESSLAAIYNSETELCGGTPETDLSGEHLLRDDTATTAATTPKRRKMPETAHHMNGYANGHAPPELQQDTTFLFTSESVGEGHPGEKPLVTQGSPA